MPGHPSGSTSIEIPRLPFADPLSSVPPQNSSNPAPIGADPSAQTRVRSYTPYTSSKHNVGRGRYITSNDPRGYLPVYEYSLGDQMIMMDCDDGYVLWTSICKALHKTKADITKMVESDPELPPRIRRIKGGYLKVQGTWIPFESARALAQRIAWPIRDDLVPLFGPDFPATCIPPNDPSYGDILNPRGRSRRNTQPAASTTSSANNAGPIGATQPWMSSSPPIPMRRDTALSEPGNIGARYSGSLSSSPRAVRMNPQGHTSPQVHPQYNLSMPSYNQLGQQRYGHSQASSPSHTLPDDGLESPYGTPGYSIQPPQAYGATYGGSFLGSSPPNFGQAPTTTYSQQPAQHTGYAMHPLQTQTSPQQHYLSQPATPTHGMSHSSFSSGVEFDGGYASHGVSGASRQPCDTYPSQDQAYSGGYGSQYQSQSDSYSQFQATSQGPTYSTYANESNVRYGDMSGYGVASSSGSRAGQSSQQQSSYGYPSSSSGGSAGSPQRTYSQQQPRYDDDGEYQSPTISHQSQQQQQQQPQYDGSYGSSSYGYQYQH